MYIYWGQCCDHNFSEKKLAVFLENYDVIIFLQQLAVFWAKALNILSNFSENIYFLIKTLIPEGSFLKQSSHLTRKFAPTQRVGAYAIVTPIL
jgi:hypothetical protein